MKAIGTPLNHCTGHNIFISFSQLNQMCQGLFHYACSPLVDVVLVIIFTTQDPIYTLKGQRTVKDIYKSQQKFIQNKKINPKKHLRKYASGKYLLCPVSSCFRIFRAFLHVLSHSTRYYGPYKNKQDLASVVKN